MNQASTTLQALRSMQIIKLDATKWKTVLDLYDALLAVIGTPKGYSRNINALLEAMVWDYAFPETSYALNPPYTIHIQNTKGLPKDILDEIEHISRSLSEACAEFHKRQYGEVDVKMNIVS
jgi:Barstar (barnase inhibitor)